MRELQILPTGVDVEGFAEIFHRHRGTLDMPAGPPAAERCVPPGFLVLADKFPKSKIAGVLLLVLVRIYPLAAAGDIAGKIDLRQLSILGKRRDPVIDRAVRLVRLSVLYQFGDDVDHFRNMMSRPWCYLRPLVAKGVKIFPKILYIRRGKFI